MKNITVCYPHSRSSYLDNLININNWPCLRINNLQQMAALSLAGMYLLTHSKLYPDNQ